MYQGTSRLICTMIVVCGTIGLILYHCNDRHNILSDFQKPIEINIKLVIYFLSIMQTNMKTIGDLNEFNYGKYTHIQILPM